MKKLTVILLLLGISIVGFTWFFHIVFDEKPPNFFPLDDAQAEYKITKNCPQGQGNVEPKGIKGYAYCLEYRGQNVLFKEEQGNSNFFSITIGKSKVDLKPLLDKKVKNIKGEYARSSKQCIQNKCIEIGGPFVVVNIDYLEVKP